MLTVVEDGPRWLCLDGHGSIIAVYHRFTRAARRAAEFAILWNDKGTGPWAGHAYTR